MSLLPEETSTGVRMSRRSVVSLAAAAVVAAGGLAIHMTSVSRADDPPRPLVDLEARTRAEHARFVRLSAPITALLEKLEHHEKALAGQDIAIEGAWAAFRNAKLTREVAEIELREYTEGIFKVENETVETRIRLAEPAIESAQGAVRDTEAQLEQVKQQLNAFVETNPDPPLRVLGVGLLGEVVIEVNAQVMAAKIRVKQAEFELEQAKAEREVLTLFKKPKRLAELNSKIEKCRSDELAKHQTHDLEVKRRGALEREVALGWWTPDEKAVLSALSEVTELEAKLPRAGAAEAGAAQTLDLIRSKLDEAERLVDVLKQKRADAEFAATAARVQGAAARVKPK